MEDTYYGRNRISSWHVGNAWHSVGIYDRISNRSRCVGMSAMRGAPASGGGRPVHHRLQLWEVMPVPGFVHRDGGAAERGQPAPCLVAIKAPQHHRQGLQPP
eukprot:scaffold1299_cov31-Prasinocladus_malaysianus.AAC.1